MANKKEVFKKKKIQDHILSDKLLNETSEEVNKENENVLIQNIDLKNNTQYSISVRKIEDLCKTPKKNVALRDSEEVNNIKIENINCSQSYNFNLDPYSEELVSNNINFLPETLATCKSEYLYNENISNKEIKKKSSNDYNQLSNVIKSELCYNEVNDMEAIDMLHDFNSIMDFEENKINTEFFCSTMNNPTQIEQTIETSQDPEFDPLFIANNENSNATPENITSQKMKRKCTVLSPKIRKKKCPNNIKKETDMENDFINNILGELDIELSLEKEENIDESDEFSEDALKRLYNLEVKLMHEVPAQHKIEHTAGTKPLTKKEKKLFLEHGPLKSGVFTPNEDKIIKDNWKAFCDIHNWNSEDVKPFLQMKNKNKFYIRTMEERQKFSQFLANGLPWRSLYSVYHRFKYLYKNQTKTFQRYTLTEDKKILSCMENKQNEKKPHKNLLKLSKILNRSQHSIWLRYKLLTEQMKNNKKSTSEVKWTLPLIGKFIKTFMHVTLCETVEDLKDAIIPKPVWQKLEEKLNINYEILKKFWIYQLHMQLFCPEPIYLNDIKIKLIEYIYGKGISDTREIVWSNVAKYFDGITTIFLCRTFLYLVQNVSIQIGTKYFPDIVHYLYHEKIQNIRNESMDKFLPRLSYKNGKVKIINEDLNEDINI